MSDEKVALASGSTAVSSSTATAPAECAEFNSWKKTFQYYTGSLNEVEKSRYLEFAKIKKADKECSRCYEFRDWLFNYSPSVRFMVDEIEKVKPGSFKHDKVFCMDCGPETKQAGGYHPDEGIMVCQNTIADKFHLEDTITHELVHYYDDMRFKVDWLNLKHHACSEIRASSLSGECRLPLQFFRIATGSKLSKGHQDCVKRRAAISVSANPNCRDEEHAKKIVDEVFENCFNDTRPFEQIYR